MEYITAPIFQCLIGLHWHWCASMAVKVSEDWKTSGSIGSRKQDKDRIEAYASSVCVMRGYRSSSLTVQLLHESVLPQTLS